MSELRCGLLLAPFGLFLGLQVSPALGTALIGPGVALAALTGLSVLFGPPVAGALFGALVQYLIRRALQ